MARRKIVAGNWKMNKTPSEAVALVEELKPLVASDDVDVVFCVPAIDIIPVAKACEGTNIAVGAENMYFEESGAYTGEISPAMLTDAGVKYVVLGHSERREYFAETAHTDYVLRRDTGAERAGRDDGFHPSAGKGRLLECDGRAGEESGHRVRADLGHRDGEDGYNAAGTGSVCRNPRMYRRDLR